MESQSVKCLVTGATGYLGTVLVKELHERGYAVTSLALPDDDVGYVSQFSGVRFADVCDMDALKCEAVGYDIVVHLAGIVDIGTQNRTLMKRVNVEGTRNVAALCLEHHMKMLYCGSVHAIACLPVSETMSEPAGFDPREVKGLYGKTKAEATKSVLAMTKQGLDAMIAMPSGIVGPYGRRLTNIEQLIVDFLCGSLKAYVDGKYNFVDVRDVVYGLCAMIDHWSSGEYYILSGHEVSVEQMLSEIAKASERRMLRVKLPYMFALCTSYLSEAYYLLMRKKPLYTHYSLRTLRSNCQFSNRKACEKIGFSARPTHESLVDMTRWVMEHFVEKMDMKYSPCNYKE